jgi:hypothetical protein
MFATWPLTLAIALSTQTDANPEVLPDTPHGRHVSAYIEAFNTGEAAFVAMYDA